MKAVRLCVTWWALLAGSSAAWADWSGPAVYLTYIDINSAKGSIVAGPFSSKEQCTADARSHQDFYHCEYLSENVYSPSHVEQHSLQWDSPSWFVVVSDAAGDSLYDGPYGSQAGCIGGASALENRVIAGKNMSFACRFVTLKLESMSDADRKWVEDNNLRPR
jgi:hypothetical protein